MSEITTIAPRRQSAIEIQMSNVSPDTVRQIDAASSSISHIQAIHPLDILG